MADLTDEEKAKLVAEGVESNADETPTEQATPPKAQETQEVDGQTEETPEEASKEAEAETETPPTFTKQFPNLKGDTWDNYGPELEKAYQNSFSEALRLKTRLDELERANAQAPPPTETPAAPAAAPSSPIDSHPDVQYAKQLREREMISAFDDFAKTFPQARESDEFNKFTAASNGVATGYAASHNGVQPTFPELFNGIAAVLGWQPSTAKKDAAIKDSASTSQTVSSAQPTARQPKVTDAQVDAYLKMFTSKTRAEAIKELSEVV